jgi:hypothetical protein
MLLQQQIKACLEKRSYATTHKLVSEIKRSYLNCRIFSTLPLSLSPFSAISPLFIPRVEGHTPSSQILHKDDLTEKGTKTPKVMSVQEKSMREQMT